MYPVPKRVEDGGRREVAGVNHEIRGVNGPAGAAGQTGVVGAVGIGADGEHIPKTVVVCNQPTKAFGRTDPVEPPVADRNHALHTGNVFRTIAKGRAAFDGSIPGRRTRESTVTRTLLETRRMQKTKYHV